MRNELKKYQRGHYDMVILNPDFIKDHSYEVIKAQNYELYKEQVLSNMDRFKPVILYGLEFMYRREPLKYSKLIFPHPIYKFSIIFLNIHAF